MEYFSLFPKAKFNNTKVTNIAVRINFIRQIKNNISLFDYIQVGEGETPESLAFLIYGDADLYWILLYINDIVDPYHEWPLSDERLTDYIIDNYGEENINAIHHYETTSESNLGAGVWVDVGTDFSGIVTVFDYEQDLNEQKRKIKIVKPEFIAQIMSELKDELK